MSEYKKDFENSIRMIDWQNDIIKNQQDKLADHETTIKFLQEECVSLRKQLISACNELMEVKR